MFVRKKHNKSGSVSVQIVDKTDGYRVVRTLGSSCDPDEIERLFRNGQDILHGAVPGQQRLFAVKDEAERAVEDFIENLARARVRTVGPELIFGTLFDRMGFHEVPDELFRHLVIARLAFPVSKLKTIDYLRRYRGITVSASSLYRSLDRFGQRHEERAKEIAYRHSRERLRTITVVFYDMTTLYFEAEDEDDLRKIGFSKDGKFQHPQIMLGLLVGEQGFPIGYDIFEGNTFEGHTLLPVLQRIGDAYNFGKPIVVADAALLSNENIEMLRENGYRFILGARIRNESNEVKQCIMEQATDMNDGDNFAIKKFNGTRLIVTHSDQRAKKDARNRERGLRKLRGRIRSGRLTKDNINNRGYNKFLTIEGDVRITIDDAKVETDALWDGLKGYITNTRLSPKKIVEHYGHLWRIEKAFRISKTDLRVRPIYHYRKRRIEAHICIAFVAYAIHKELEYQLQQYNAPFSAERAAALTQTMYTLEYAHPRSRKYRQTMLYMDEEQQILHKIIHGV